ncbi:MAG: serine protease [Ignavibacteriales bacterium]|nr:serine protease [Ignavibacteriales bacterium]
MISFFGGCTPLKLLLELTLLLFSFQLMSAQEQMYQNVVRIRTTFSNHTLQDGFGFVICERSDCLYIATALHVVANEDPALMRVNSIVSFYQSTGGQEALLVMTDDRLDLALLIVDKPSWYTWRWWCRVLQAEVNDQVWIIGFSRQWITEYQQSKGIVVQARGNTIQANFTGLQPGCSGGPLMSGNEIVGMVLEDAGTRINAVGIRAILQTAYDYMEVNPTGEFDLPFLAAGGVIGGSGLASSNLGAKATLGYSVFTEAMVVPRLSLCATGAYDFFAAKVSVDNQDREFQNPITSYGLCLKYYFDFWAEMPLRVLPTYVRVGVSHINHNPQIRFNGGIWTNLRDRQGQGLSYSKSGYLFESGLGFGWKGSTLAIGVDFSFIYATEPLGVDLLRPYEGATTHLFVRAGLYLGYSLRTAEPKVKAILR